MALDWRGQLRKAARTLSDVEQTVRLTEQERRGLHWAEHGGMPVLIPPYVLSLIDTDDPQCPIRRQFIPRAEESQRVRGDLSDPLGEREHEVAPRLVHRYPDRALLLVTSTCAVHCRYCTRARLVGTEDGYWSLSELEPAFRWLEAHPQVREVLISGGDPLVVSTRRLDALLWRIRRISSIDVIRVGTRVPNVLPMRVDDELVTMLRAHQPLWIMTHFNHPRELTALSCHALAQLVDGGFPVMNQTVLLRGINDDDQVLATLFRGLVRQRVRPYYLLHADVMEGTSHFRTSVARGLEIYSRLQGKVSGLAIPRLMVDTPGGKGKVPLGPVSVVSMESHKTVLRTFRGEEVVLIEPGQFEGHR